MQTVGGGARVSRHGVSARKLTTIGGPPRLGGCRFVRLGRFFRQRSVPADARRALRDALADASAKAGAALKAALEALERAKEGGASLDARKAVGDARAAATARDARDRRAGGGPGRRTYVPGRRAATRNGPTPTPRTE